MGPQETKIFLSAYQKLKESGYDRDWLQCRLKIKNLKVDYKKLKDYNGETGKKRKTCKFFEKLDVILGTGQRQLHPFCLMLV